MALSGVHISFSFINDGTVFQKHGATLPYQPQSSQVMASAGTSTISAPAAPGKSVGQTAVLLSIRPSLPIYYTVGKNPDINAGPTRYVDPTTMLGGEDIFVDAGDKVAWTTA